MKEDIKIPIIVKVSYGLVIAEAILAVLYSLFLIVTCYGEAKWSMAATLGAILLLLHILFVWVAFRAVIKRKEKDSKTIGFVMLAFVLLFLKLIFVKAAPAPATIAYIIFSAFFCFNGIVFIYWARQIKKSLTNSTLSNGGGNEKIGDDSK